MPNLSSSFASGARVAAICLATSFAIALGGPISSIAQPQSSPAGQDLTGDESPTAHAREEAQSHDETQSRDETGGKTEDADAAARTGEPALDYTVAIHGVGDEELEDILERSSRLRQLSDRPPATRRALLQRVSEDLERFQTALRSEGFYDATIDVDVPEEGEPLPIRFEVETGPVYLLADYTIVYDDPAALEAGLPEDGTFYGVDIGARARAPTIAAVQQRLLRDMENHGFPLAAVTDRRVVVNHEDRTMTVRLDVAPGPLVSFGPVEIEGLESVDEDYVRSFFAWNPGEEFDQRKVEEARSGLAATGLFSGTSFTLAEAPDDQGRLPQTLTLVEREKRSLGFGADYSSAEGLSGNAFWEHRNILGQNERLRISADLGLIEQSVIADLRKPRYLRPDQDLLIRGGFERQDSDAFREETLGAFIGLERQLTGRWRAGLGTSAEATMIADPFGENNYTIFGLPATLSRDSRDDVLNPARGSRLDIAVTPYVFTIDDTDAFLQTMVGGSAYQALDGNDRVILAGRARVGTIFGASRSAIPASKRFYAGGGGSVRGYEFEKVGPLDADGNPLGGRSLIEVGAELRLRLSDTFGIVPFVEGGNVYDTNYPTPDFSGEDELQWAAGLGLRYYTGIGPLRFDVAVPINRRDSDSRFEFYISLGQAF